MNNPYLIGGGEDGKGDVIIQQEEKIVDKDGNVEIKERTLRNPTKEELDTKTLEELDTDEGDDVTTIKTFKIKLSDNDLSDHSFSSFGLDNPKDANTVSVNTTEGSKSVVKSFFWFSIKMGAVLGVGIILFSAYKSYLRNSNTKKRRYHSPAEDTSDAKDSDDDEEELGNIRSAVRRNGNGSNLLTEDDIGNY